LRATGEKGVIEVIRQEADVDRRYRITRTDRGLLVTMRSKDTVGLTLPCEWLHQTEAAAHACLDFIMAFEAAWRASRLGYDIRPLMAKVERLGAEHKALCERLDDTPLVGQEIRALRDGLDTATESESKPPST
jgi:hypothetical protein